MPMSLHLRVTAVPFMFVVSLSEDGRLTGRFGGMFHTLCAMMNATYTVSPPPDSAWGNCNQTDCSGMFAPVLRNESDVALGPHSLLETYAQHFEPGNPMDSRHFRIITGMRTPYAVDSSAVLRVLDTGMYMCLFLSPWVIAGLVVIIVGLQHRAFKESSRDPLDFGVLVMAGYQTLLNQSGEYLNRSASSRLIVVAFLLVSLFVSVLFSSFVKASMMNKPPTKRISYLRELVKEEHLRPLVVEKSYITDLIATQGEVNSDYKALNEIFRKHGLIKRPIEMLSVENTAAILNGTGFAIGLCRMFKFFYYRGWQSLRSTDKGYYYCSRDVVLSVHVTWYFSRTTLTKEFIREFNRRSRWLRESPQNFVREYRRPQIPQWSRVYDTPLTDEKADPILLHDILGSVFIYLGGMALSCTLLVVELIAKVVTINFKGFGRDMKSS